jgi:D-3-phosphoglycerate dehydrogenase
MKTVIVTPRSISRDGHAALTAIEDAGYRVLFPTPGRQPTENEIITVMDDCVGYLAGVEPITARVLDTARSLRVISRNGVGVDNIDLDAADRWGVIVRRAVGANARGVAELAIGHMIAAARGIATADGALKNGIWSRSKGIELYHRVLGLIGFGSIGRIVASIALGMGMRVRTYDPFLPTDAIGDDRIQRVELNQLITESDVISLHCPPNPEGYVVGENEIASMKEGCILINTARDGLVDPDAAAAALTVGHLRAVTVDAFAEEPPSDYSFVKMKGVIGTPHIGGYTTESIDRAVEQAVENILSVLEGGEQ